MSSPPRRVVETVTLGQAKGLLHALAREQSLLLLSPPGVGKSETVARAAAEAGLPCKSLLGTQIAPEDVSGVPRIVGERSVFCPPRVLLPESPEPFCLFLDELPACAPDVQKAFYSLLLERRLGEHALPAGTWVVAAGNRIEDRALVRGMSSALINRVILLNIRVDLREWLVWAKKNGVREEILAFMIFLPDALLRPPPADPGPFSTPRAWTSLSRALDLAEKAGILGASIRRALAFGRVSPEDAAVFCVMIEEKIRDLLTAPEYVVDPALMPAEPGARWLVVNRVREAAARGELDGLSPEIINRFLMALPSEHRFALLVDRVEAWGRLGADEALRASLREVTGLLSAGSAGSDDARAIDAALKALRSIPAHLPELAELVPLVRVTADARIETAGIFLSGRMVVCPEWFLALRPGDAVFVVAHELMHLSLRTHDRQGGMDARVVNVAHDYIINDLLRAALHREIPAGGLDMPGARELSLEDLVSRIAPEVRKKMIRGSFAAPRRAPAMSPLGAALGKSGHRLPDAPAREGFDVLDGEVERRWFPGEPVSALNASETRVREAALLSVSLGELRRGIDAAFQGRGTEAGGATAVIEALQTAYRPPWEEALQTFLEAVAPGERTYARASRRGGDRTDVALPGRRREGWTLHLVLDTSGSMVSEFARILGAIASFCEGVNVSLVHVLQCDVEVTRDELVEVEALRSFPLAGFGGSDLSPGMRRLAQDPEVLSAIVITDGYIAYPEEPMPYAVLWAVTQPYFQAPYGRVVHIEDSAPSRPA